MEKIKKPISILLTVIMVISLFTVVPFTASANETHTHDGITFEPWNGTDTLPESGSYYLTQDVWLASTADVTGTLNLCLNGHGVTASDMGYSVITVDSGGVLNLYDCDTATEHKYIVYEIPSQEPMTGLMGFADLHGSLDLIYPIVGDIDDYIHTLIGGFITGANTMNGGGVYLQNSTFNMYGGTIIGNQAWFHGGGVCVEGGTFNLNGGNITNNLSGTYGGGAACTDEAEMVINSGCVNYNKADFGGGVYVSESILTLKDGSVSYNIGETGSGIENYAGTVDLDGGLIEGNVAAHTDFIPTALHCQGSISSGDGDAVNLSGTSISGVIVFNSPLNITGDLGDRVYEVRKEADGTTEPVAGVVTCGISGKGGVENFANGNGEGFRLITNSSGEVELVSVQAFTVTWKNYDGTILETDENTAAGEIPAYNGDSLARDDDDDFSYSHSGWSDGTTEYSLDEQLPAVSGDVTYTATFTKIPKSTAFFAGHTLSLEGDIRVNFFIDPSAVGVSIDDIISGDKSIRVDFSWGTSPAPNTDISQYSITVDKDNYNLKDNYLVVSCQVAAAEMSCLIRATAKVDDFVIENMYSVQRYCEIVLDRDSYFAENYIMREGIEKYEKLVDLVTKMLDYGAKAQEVFDVIPDDPANSILTDYITEENVTAEMIDSAISSANGGRTASDLTGTASMMGAKCYAVSLIYLSNCTLRLYFTKSTPDFDPSIYDGNISDCYYYVEVKNIYAAELDVLQEFKAGDIVFYYSALDYVKAILCSDMEQSAKNLAKSLYWYNQAARAFLIDSE